MKIARECGGPKPPAAEARSFGKHACAPQASARAKDRAASAAGRPSSRGGGGVERGSMAQPSAGRSFAARRPAMHVRRIASPSQAPSRAKFALQARAVRRRTLMARLLRALRSASSRDAVRRPAPFRATPPSWRTASTARTPPRSPARPPSKGRDTPCAYPS